jgi:hypothetical protein
MAGRVTQHLSEIWERGRTPPRHQANPAGSRFVPARADDFRDRALKRNAYMPRGRHLRGACELSKEKTPEG